MLVPICTLKTALLSWRIYNMSKTTMKIAKTVGIGLIAGAAAMTVSSIVTHQQHPHYMQKMKKTANHTMHKMGNIIGAVETMIG